MLSTDRQFLLEYYWEDLIKNLNICDNPVIDELIAREVLSPEEVQTLEIKKKKFVDYNKTKFLGLLLQKGDSEFQLFLDALVETEQGRLIQAFLSDKATQNAIQELQEHLSKFYKLSFYDNMFCYHEFGSKIDLRELYVSPQCVRIIQKISGRTERKKVDSYLDLLKKLPNAITKVVVEASPTAGKTTFTRKVCYDWASIHSADRNSTVDSGVQATLGQYTILIPIMLHFVNPQASLESTIAEQLEFMTDKHMQTMKWLLKKDPSKIIMVFDGLDEYHDNTADDISRIMKGILYNEMCCIVTSRPEAAVKINDWKRTTYIHAGLDGLNNEGIKLLVRKFFAENPEKAEALLQKIFNKSNTYLLDLSRNPGTLVMLCVLFDNDRPISANLQVLYLEYVSFLLSHYESKAELPKSPQGEILQNHHDILCKFGHLANSYDGAQMKLSFKQEEITKEIGQNAFSYGFLNYSQPKSRLQGIRINFRHRSLQEFLASYYIYHKELELFKQNFKNYDFHYKEENIIKFILHLWLEPKEVYNLIKDSIQCIELKHQLIRSLLAILFGYQHDVYFEPLELMDEKSKFLYRFPYYVIQTENDDLSLKTTEIDNFITVDKSKECMLTVNLQGNNRIDQLEVANSELFAFNNFFIYSKNFSEKFGSIIACYQDTPVSVVGDVSNLQKLKLAGLQNVEVINLQKPHHDLDIDITSTILPVVPSNIASWMLFIKSLTLSYCGLDKTDLAVLSKDLDTLAPSLCSSKSETVDSLQLQQLSPSKVPLTLTSQHGEITTPTEFQTSHLSYAESTNCSSDLQIYCSPCTKPAVLPNKLSKYLKGTLQCLNLAGNKLTGAGGEISRLLSYTLTVTKLDLSNCSLNNEDFIDIVNTVADRQHKSPIEKFYLYGNSLSCVATLVKMLQCSPNLKKLGLNDNEFTDDIREIMNHKNSMRTMIELHVRHNKLSKEMKDLIKQTLESNTNAKVSV